MITADYARTMARYNRWQNRSHYREADKLTDAARKEPRGAFFGSIHGTLSHILYGDQVWMYRFTGESRPRAATIPDSVGAYPDWDELKRERIAFDARVVAWADTLDERWLDGQMTWKPPALSHEITRPHRLLVVHLFNHQTHHRGQVHCMLTALGMKPDDTDLHLMPD